MSTQTYMDVHIHLMHGVNLIFLWTSCPHTQVTVHTPTHRPHGTWENVRLRQVTREAPEMRCTSQSPSATQDPSNLCIPNFRSSSPQSPWNKSVACSLKLASMGPAYIMHPCLWHSPGSPWICLWTAAHLQDQDKTLSSDPLVRESFAFFLGVRPPQGSCFC